MKKLSMRNLARRNPYNPIGLSAGALIVGGAAVAGGGYWAVDHSRSTSPSGTAGGPLEYAGDVGIVVGLAAAGAGAGSMIHGKMGGLIGVRALTRATGATLVP